MKPQKPLPTYPATQPSPQPLSTPRPNASQNTARTGLGKRPRVSDIGPPGIASRIVEVVLYIFGGLALLASFFTFLDAVGTRTDMPKELENLADQLACVWALGEACSGVLLLALGLILNHLRNSTILLRSLFDNQSP